MIFNPFCRILNYETLGGLFVYLLLAAKTPQPQTNMKFIIFIIGIAVGGLIVYLIKPAKQPPSEILSASSGSTKTPNSNWHWHDSLDALKAAPGNHELIYEDKDLRILKVTVVPGILDPIHTHKGRSLVWVTMTSPILYHHYDLDNGVGLHKVKTDTIDVKTGELYKASWENPEPPHSVENIGKDTFQLYRIEYKKA